MGKVPDGTPLDLRQGMADPKITWDHSEQWSQPPEIMTKVQRSAGAHNLSKYHLQQQSLAALEAPPSTAPPEPGWVSGVLYAGSCGGSVLVSQLPTDEADDV